MQGNVTNQRELSAKQEKAIAALLSETTIEAAAAKVGVNAATVFRWLQDPAFASAYREARRQAVQQAISRLQHVSFAAVTVLLQVMAEKATPAGVRLRAAIAVLEFAIRSVELEDLEARITALEALYKERA